MSEQFRRIVSRAILGAMVVAAAAPTYAAQVNGPKPQAGSAVELARVNRPPHPGMRPPHAGVRPPHVAVRPPHPGVRPPLHGHYYPRHDYYRPNGLAIGAGIVGGIIAGAAIADAAQQDGYSRCAAEFRSFNPETGTYVGYDGVVRACPYLR